MLQHMRSTWLAGAGAVLLVLSMTGLAAAATLVTDTTPSTIATFEDLNGNGIDDDCEAAVTANADAVTLAMAAVDTDANGVISTTEAAHSGWVGGLNCNHGGYVSTVAHTSGDACDAADAAEAPEAPEASTDESTDQAKAESSDGSNEDSNDDSTDSNHAVVEASTGTTTIVTTPACAADEPATTDTTAPVVCPVVPVVPVTTGTTVATTPLTHVQVAQSDAVGGKNCNHGGAVSESAKAANAARKAAHALDHAAKMAAKHHGKGHNGQN
jgi:hypothetical protein